MGAQTFETMGAGKTAQEAFSSARDSAAWEHGHGGYTGSLAEKHDFIMIEETAETLKPKLERQLLKEIDESGPGDWVKYRQAIIDKLDANASPDQIADAMMSFGDERIRDKWGPAGCLEVSPGRYLFFGWASS